MHNKSKIISRSAVLILLLSMSAPIFAADTKQQNAADIYKMALDLYQYDDEVLESIRNYAKGVKEPDEIIRRHIKANAEIIKMIVQASLLDHCDWNFEYLDLWFETSEQCDGKSKDYSDVLYEIRRLNELLIADARILAKQGNVEKAIERCMNSYYICRHIDSRSYIGFLVMTAYESMAADTIIDIISEHRFTPEMLKSLKQDLINHFKLRHKLINSLNFESLRYIEYLDKMDADQTKAHILEGLIGSDDPNSLDDVWYKCEYVNSGSQYFSKYNKSLRDIIQKPYQKAYPAMIKLLEKARDDVFLYDESKKIGTVNCGALLTDLDYYSIQGIYTVNIINASYRNAFLCAVNLYSIEAKTGKLPDKLPSNSPKDVFSGKDFIYEKNKEGFTLCCQAKDIRENKIHQWEFKVKH